MVGHQQTLGSSAGHFAFITVPIVSVQFGRIGHAFGGGLFARGHYRSRNVGRMVVIAGGGIPLGDPSYQFLVGCPHPSPIPNPCFGIVEIRLGAVGPAHTAQGQALSAQVESQPAAGPQTVGSTGLCSPQITGFVIERG